MNTKIVLGALCAGILAMATACGTPDVKKVEPKMMKPANECVLKGDWHAAPDTSMEAGKQRTMMMTFAPNGTDIASGMYKIGNKEEPNTRISGSLAVAKAIEGGKEDVVTWNGARTADCKLTFVDECAKLKLTCESSAPFMLERVMMDDKM